MQPVNIEQASAAILALSGTLSAHRSVLVAISGIDGSGKGFVASKIAAHLQSHVPTAIINIDGWLNLSNRRFELANPSQNFYEHAIRLDEMFRRLVRPLKQIRSDRLVADFTEETASEYRTHTYEINAV